MPVPIPTPSYLDTCEPLGFIYGERRWRDRFGRLLTWDSLHGEIEVFNARGAHLGVLDYLGRPIKPAKKGRRIHV